MSRRTWITQLLLLTVLEILLLLLILFPSLSSRPDYAGFFSADYTTYPDAGETLLVDSLSELFEGLRLTPNDQEDAWLIHPDDNGYLALDFGSDSHQHDTVREVVVEHEQMLNYLSETAPEWFVLLHQHPVGSISSPSSTDLVYLYSVETDLDMLSYPGQATSVVVFHEGYFLFSLTERFRNLVRTSLDNPEPIMPNPGWSSFQMRWDCYMVKGHDMTDDFPDYQGFVDAAASMINLAYFADAEDLAGAIIQCHSLDIRTE